MPRTIGRLESLLGRKCPSCGVTEWNWHYRNRELRRWSEGSWWNRKKYLELEHTHPECGFTWTEVQDITPTGGGA